jgi:hypothetical protein
MVGLALQVELPMVAASIPSPKVGEECCNSGPDARLEVMVTNIHLEVMVTSIQLQEAVVAMSKSARLWETLPTTSRVLDPYENPVTQKLDSCKSKKI